MNFVKEIYKTWTGKEPSEKQEVLFNACLSLLIDNGPETLSAKATKIITSGGNDLNASVAGGLLAAGNHHGALVIKNAGEIIAKREPVEEVVKEYDRVPGFGHPEYKDGDPRVIELYKLAEELEIIDEYVDYAKELEQSLPVKMNIDGAIASLLPALGIKVEYAPGIFLVARTAGLVKHANDEKREKPMSQR